MLHSPFTNTAHTAHVRTLKQKTEEKKTTATTTIEFSNNQANELF